MKSFVERLYETAPVWLQNAALSAYGVRKKVQEYGSEFERLLEEFERQQWYSKAELEAFQNEKLSSIIRHAYETVPFYRRHFRQHGLRPSDIIRTEHLVKIPPLSPSTIADHGADLVSRTAGRRDRIKGHTSGTTGRAKTLFYDRQVVRVKNAVDYRMKRMAGVKFGDPIAYLMGRSGVPISQQDPPFWRINRGMNHLLLSIFHLAPERYDLYLDALESFGAEAVDGYPSTISMVAEAFESRGRKYSMQAAFMTSEMVVPHQRTVIERVFECEAFDYYGLAERAVFAHECPAHEGLHVNSDFGYCEIVDENDLPVGPGETGTVVVTGWHNRTMPLIRYKTTDRATFAARSCSCGRAFPLLKSIDGRHDDQIATPDGRYLDVSFAYGALEMIQDKIRASQLVQSENGDVAVRVVPRVPLTKEEIRGVVRALQQFMGAQAVVRVETWKDLPRSPSGKFQWLISHVPRRMV